MYSIRSYPTVALFVALVCGVASTASLRAERVLRWKLQPEQRFRAEITQTTKQIMNSLGSRVEIPQEISFDMSWVVDEVDSDGIIHMTQVIEGLTMSTEQPGQGKIVYDSSSDDEPTGLAKILQGVMSPLVGARMSHTMTDRGKIIEVVLPEEAMAGFKKYPIMQEVMSKDFIRDMYRQASPEFPETPLSQGVDWTSNVETKSGFGKMNIESTYSYHGIENKNGRELDRIEVTMNVKLPKDANPPGADVEIKAQESTGVMLFDNEAGHLVESRTVRKVQLEMKVLGNVIEQHVETVQQVRLKFVAAETAENDEGE